MALNDSSIGRLISDNNEGAGAGTGIGTHSSSSAGGGNGNGGGGGLMVMGEENTQFHHHHPPRHRHLPHAAVLSLSLGAKETPIGDKRGSVERGSVERGSAIDRAYGDGDSHTIDDDHDHHDEEGEYVVDLMSSLHNVHAHSNLLHSHGGNVLIGSGNGNGNGNVLIGSGNGNVAYSSSGLDVLGLGGGGVGGDGGEIVGGGGLLASSSNARLTSSASIALGDPPVLSALLLCTS